MTSPQPILPLCICQDPLCSIPYGFCHCKCGGKSPLCRDNDKSRGFIGGMPHKFIRGHASRVKVKVITPPFRDDKGVLCRLIPLTQGKSATVWESDYEWLMQWHWQVRWAKKSNWYALRAVQLADGRHTTITMHQQIMGSRGVTQVDHISVDGLDNRRSNLRPATVNQQMQNRKIQKNNSSGFKCVYRRKEPNNRKKKFLSSITVNGVKKFLGSFYTAETASEAYKVAAVKYFGEFARFE